MGLRIQNNVEAFNTHRQLNTTSTAAAKSMEKLSSGYRINRAADDAAGLAISEKMRGQIGGLAVAQRNAQDGISLVQTAEGALTEVHSMLQRVRDLKVQYQNGTNSSDDKGAIAAEVSQISQEINDIVTQTKFNGTAVFNTTSGFSFQVGANDSETVSTTAAQFSGTIASGGLSGITNITSASGASAALESGGALANISSIDDAIKNVSKVRADFGAVQNRLEHRLNNLATYQENLTASESRIRDVDMAA
ncbi:flagellin N-terminal helical domain-containing protein, partial [Solirubrobacter soli]|uniref:flagellin N-terminal helical domain-containing protein n=1 Tax=Solirubrobacter soli TaxID=363832 RepID=UPI0004844DA7